MFAKLGVKLGHWTNPTARTGCTVLLLPEGAVGSAEVRGGAPASRELEALSPERTVNRVDAVVLTGGSAFGLASADGVMRFLEERGRGVPTPAGPVPIVPSLGLFDLAVGDAGVRPGPREGYAACAAAEADGSDSPPDATAAATKPFAPNDTGSDDTGSADLADHPAPAWTSNGIPGAPTGANPLAHDLGALGAGAGATVGKIHGFDAARPGGLVVGARRRGPLIVACVVAVNAFGVVDADGSAAARLADRLPSGEDRASGPETVTGQVFGNTTIGAIVTNARLTKTGCLVVCQGAHDGLARAVVPPHTRVDGDAFVAVATGEVEADVDTVRLLALTTVAEAIRALAA